MANQPGRLRGRGFTLLELILVLAIVATILSFAAPSLDVFYAGRRVEDAAGHWLALAEQARARAVAEARPYQLHMDAAAQTYWLTAETGGVQQRPASELGRTFRVEPPVRAVWRGDAAEQQRTWITFHPDGRTDPVEVVFDDDRGERLAVICPAVAAPMRIGEPTEVGRDAS